MRNPSLVFAMMTAHDNAPMRPLRSAIVFIALVSALAAVQTSPTSPYKDPRLQVDARVQDLLARMTLEEKFWQLFMIPGRPRQPGERLLERDLRPADLHRAPPVRRRTARGHAERINAIQRYFVEKTRLGIPIIPFEEAVHGLARDGATMFPAAIALAATWDQPLDGAGRRRRSRARRGARGIRQVLSPVINIADDVRWGRVEETYGEDPFLSSVMAPRVRRRRSSAPASSPRRSTSSPTSAKADATAIRSITASALLDRAVLSAVRGGDPRGARAVGHDRLQLRGRIAGDAESRAC